MVILATSLFQVFLLSVEAEQILIQVVICRMFIFGLIELESLKLVSSFLCFETILLAQTLSCCHTLMLSFHQTVDVRKEVLFLFYEILRAISHYVVNLCVYFQFDVF